jgi:ubiquinone/menaquinone biosynthesis C-methylase UbiE
VHVVCADSIGHAAASRRMPVPAIEVLRARELAASGALPIPRYLDQLYWWAYVHPNAVHLFERQWLVNAILFGNYGRLRNAALDELGATVNGRTLQVACVYGDLTPRQRERLAGDAQLDVVDILPMQLDNLDKKLPPDKRVALRLGDASSLPSADAHYDQVLLFFLLHEMPQRVRRATLGEAMRVLKPGGKLVIVDYHRPARWHPLRPLMRQVFRHLEPHAFDLWEHAVERFMPAGPAPAASAKRTFFGGLYQKLVLTRSATP